MSQRAKALTIGNESSGEMVLNVAAWIQVSQGMTKGALREEF